MNKKFLGLFGGIYILGGIILYKLNNIQKEIEYFEYAKNIYYNRKEYERILNKESKK